MLDSIFGLLPLAARLGRTSRDVQQLAWKGAGYGAEWLGTKLGMGGVGRSVNEGLTRMGNASNLTQEWSASVLNSFLEEEDQTTPGRVRDIDRSGTSSGDLTQAWNRLSGKDDFSIGESTPGVVTSLNEAGKKKRSFWDTITRPVNPDDPLENRFSTAHIYFGNTTKRSW